MEDNLQKIIYMITIFSEEFDIVEDNCNLINILENRTITPGLEKHLESDLKIFFGVLEGFSLYSHSNLQKSPFNTDIVPSL